MRLISVLLFSLIFLSQNSSAEDTQKSEPQKKQKTVKEKQISDSEKQVSETKDTQEQDVEKQKAEMKDNKKTVQKQKAEMKDNKKTVQKQKAEMKDNKKAAQKTMKKRKASSKVNVTRAEICKNVIDREPQESGSQFGKDIKTLYCFSRIKGVKDSIKITHKWYKGDNLVSQASLPVKSSNWRTWSMHNFDEESVAGKWKVEIINSEDGVLLKTIEFEIN